MRRGFGALLLCGTLAGCGVPMHWEKPGADLASTQKDIADCRIAARDEAIRTYYPAPAPLLPPRRWLAWEQYSDSQRFYAESNLTQFCMRNKGYALVPSQPQTPAPEK